MQWIEQCVSLENNGHEATFMLCVSCKHCYIPKYKQVSTIFHFKIPVLGWLVGEKWFGASFVLPSKN